MNKSIGTLITALLILLMAGSAMCATYNDNVTLAEKEGFGPEGEWNIVDGGASSLVEFNDSGDKFAWRAAGAVPNFDIEQTCFCYALIYYADRDDRFVNWDGSNPGRLIDTFEVDKCDGTFDTGDMVKDIDMNLPEYPDWNINPDPWDTYCNESGDNYTNCCGAKLWIVPCTDYDEPAMIAWNPANYLFETDLIWYDDTDVDLAPEIIETFDDGKDYYAGDEPGVAVSAIVCDNDGVGDLESMTVTANYSQHGIEELIAMEFVEMIDCTCAYYESEPVVITQSTCECDCYDLDCEQVDVEIVATDSSGEYDEATTDFYVYPGPCAYMELKNYQYCEEELRTKALTHLWDCNTCPVMWWCDDEMFDIYMLTYGVWLYDEYDNCIGPVNEVKCCDEFTVTLDEGSSASLKYTGQWWSHDNHIVIVNELLPGETTLTVHCVCEGECIPDISQTVEFLYPVSSLNVTSDADVIYATDECSNDELINISAQIVGPFGNPVLMPRVPVTLYVDCMDYDTEMTDDNGTAYFIGVDVSGREAGTEVNFRAEAECREGNLTLSVVEPVLGMVVIDDPISPVNCSDEQQLEYDCYNVNGNPMCCPECNPCCPNIIWTSDALGDVNETGYFTALDSGTAVVEVNVSGVTDTAEIVIDCPENCTDEPNQCQTYPYSFVVTSGSVSLAGNFTAPGHACIEALGDPIAEFDNDTRGAIVDVNETATKNVTLDLNGTGDTWKYNETTGNWSKYADGAVSEVLNGTYALVTPGVDPEPACTNVVITPEDPVDVVVGDTVTFTANCTDQFDVEIDCSDLTWTSDNETVGTMDSDSPILTARAPGVTNVTATGCGDSDPIQVNVSVAPVLTVDTINVTPASPVTMNMTDTETFTAVCKNGTTELTGITVTWNSSNTTVGLDPVTGMSTTFMALANGTTTITATAQGVTSNAVSVTVSAESLIDRYDANDDGVISKDEAITAIMDYFDDKISKEDALEVIMAYFG